MIELRDISLDFHSLSGVATTWTSPGEDRSYFVSSREHTFREQVARNAFSDATSGRDTVELLRDHNPDGPTYASTSNRTMKLADGNDGLLLAAALRKSDASTQTAVADIRAGRLSGLSVGMRVREDRWSTWTDGRTALRTITAASLGEVSLVRRPANPSAVVNELRNGDLEYRSVPLIPRQGDETDETLTCPVCGFNGPPDQFGDTDRSEGSKHRHHTPPRSAVLGLNDSYALRMELEELNAFNDELGVLIEVAGRTRALKRPAARRREPIRHPDQVLRDTLAAEYERMVS